MRTQNLLKLPKKTVDQVERRLARFVSAPLWLQILKASDDELRLLAKVWPGATPANPFEEPDSHRKAREILGSDFHGVAIVEKHFGVLTDDERKQYVPLCLRDHKTGQFLSEEQTLIVLEQCKGTHVLCAMHRTELPSVHARKKERFTLDPDNPWIGTQEQRVKWSGELARDPWVLARKAVVPESTSKNVDQQKAHLEQRFPKERSLLPVEYAQIAVVHFLETKEKLGGDLVVRFWVQTAGGCWVRADWVGDRLRFYYWNANAASDIGSLSARASF